MHVGPLVCLMGLCVALMGCDSGSAARHDPDPMNVNQPTRTTAVPASEAISTSNHRPGMQSDEEFIHTVRTELVEAHSSFDGNPVIDLQFVSSCAATLLTSVGKTTFRWAELGDLAATDDGKNYDLPLMTGSQTHHLTLSSGHEADQINGSLGILEMQCQGK